MRRGSSLTGIRGHRKRHSALRRSLLPDQPALDPLISPSNTRLIPASSDRPGDDPIFALNAEAKLRASAGELILNSTLGALMDDQGQLAVMPSVFAAYESVSPQVAAGYAPIAGPPSFLSAVIEDLFGASVLGEHAVATATPGGTGALNSAIVNFLEPGQALLTSSYYWGPYGVLATHSARGVKTFEMFEGEGGGLNVAALEAALDELASKQGRILLFLNTPCHNPTGYTITDADWNAIIPILQRVSERVPLTLLLDMAYSKFAAPGSITWPKHLERLLGSCTLLFAWTASKAFAQYGARVGALVAVDSDAAQLKRLQNALSFTCRGTWSNCNHYGMLAITELLKEGQLKTRCEAEREEVRQLLSERVQVFNALAAKAGLGYPPYEGGFFVSVFTPDAKRTAELMRADGVFVVPLNGAVRIAICATPATQLPRLVQSLKVALAVVRG